MPTTAVIRAAASAARHVPTAATRRAAAAAVVLAATGALAPPAGAVGTGVGGYGFEEYPHPGSVSTLVLALEAQGGGPLPGATVEVEGTKVVTDAEGRARVTRLWAPLRRSYTVVVDVPPPAGGETMRVAFKTSTLAPGDADVPRVGPASARVRRNGTTTLRLTGEVPDQARRWARKSGGMLAALVPPAGARGACSRIVRTPLATFSGTGDRTVATLRIRPSAVRGGRWCRGRWTAHVVMSEEAIVDEAGRPAEEQVAWDEIQELGVLGVYEAVGDARFTVR